MMSAACLSVAGSTLMALTCLECCKIVLRGTSHVRHGSLKCTHGPSTAAPNGLTVLHAAALGNSAEAVAEALAAAARNAACAPAGSTALDAELDRGGKYSLHLTREICGVDLTDEKHVSKFYCRLHGCTPLEVAVTLGHSAPAAALLAAGAAVRSPQAWEALTRFCPPAARDCLSALLAACQVIAWAATASSLPVEATVCNAHHLHAQ